MTTILECARHGCTQLFTRVTCQKYCTPECRKADRKCCECRASIPIDQPGTKNTQCRPCAARRARDRRRSAESRQKTVSAVRAKKYGITSDEYLSMSEAQGHKCAICGNEETSRTNNGEDPRTLSVDHCHDTGRVRGLLCGRCNAALGFFGDDVDVMARAIEYVRAASDVAA